MLANYALLGLWMIIVPPLGPDKQILDTRRGNAKVRAMYHIPFFAAHGDVLRYRALRSAAQV